MSRRLAVTIAILVAVAIALAAGGAQRWALAVQRDDAERSFRDGRFRDAYQLFHALSFERTRRHDPTDVPSLDYDAGASAYRLGHFADAVTGFRSGLTGGGTLQEHSAYNLGNSYVWLSRGEPDKRSTLRAAVSAYEDALLLDPNDVDAKWNLEIAAQRLAAEQERLGGGPHRQADWGGGNLTKSGYAGTPQTAAGATPGGGFGGTGGEEPVQQITETQARRLLKELERGEISGQDVRRAERDRRPVRRRDW